MLLLDREVEGQDNSEVEEVVLPKGLKELDERDWTPLLDREVEGHHESDVEEVEEVVLPKGLKELEGGACTPFLDREVEGVVFQVTVAEQP